MSLISGKKRDGYQECEISSIVKPLDLGLFPQAVFFLRVNIVKLKSLQCALSRSPLP